MPAGSPQYSLGREDSQDRGDEEEVEDEVLRARSLFDVREFKRAAHAVEGCSSKKATFLRLYALYLVRAGRHWMSRCHISAGLEQHHIGNAGCHHKSDGMWVTPQHS